MLITPPLNLTSLSILSLELLTYMYHNNIRNGNSYQEGILITKSVYISENTQVHGRFDCLTSHITGDCGKIQGVGHEYHYSSTHVDLLIESCYNDQ